MTAVYPPGIHLQMEQQVMQQLVIVINIIIQNIQYKTVKCLKYCTKVLLTNTNVPTSYYKHCSTVIQLFYLQQLSYHTIISCKHTYRLYYTANTDFCCLIWQYKQIHKSHLPSRTYSHQFSSTPNKYTLTIVTLAATINNNHQNPMQLGFIVQNRR